MLLRSKELYCGETVDVVLKNSPDAYVWGGVTLPVLIEKEFKYYYLGTVLPHYNPHGYGESTPYPITLHKTDVDNGGIIVKLHMV